MSPYGLPTTFFESLLQAKTCSKYSTSVSHATKVAGCPASQRQHHAHHRTSKRLAWKHTPIQIEMASEMKRPTTNRYMLMTKNV